jgi:outer membrane protein OmpA-like peptidoglycan-associated protein
VSNPGDRWRKSWMVGAVGVALLAALTLGRCASRTTSDRSENAIVAGASGGEQASGVQEGVTDSVDVANAVDTTETIGATEPGGVDASVVEEPAPDESVPAAVVETTLVEAPIVDSSVSQAVVVDTEPSVVAPDTTTTFNSETTTIPIVASTTSPVSTTVVSASVAAAPDVASALETTGGTIALEGVQFDLGSARLTAESATVLDRLVTTLADNPELNIAISGHTDNTGDKGFNKTLSTARAKSVRRYLTNKGIAESRLTAKGLGDTQPRADNKTQAGRRQNRRIEVTAAP